MPSGQIRPDVFSKRESAVEEKRIGQVAAVNGNMVAVNFQDRVMQNEVAYVNVGEERLKSEVIRVRGKRADLQVFEDTAGVKVGDATAIVITERILDGFVLGLGGAFFMLVLGSIW